MKAIKSQLKTSNIFMITQSSIGGHLDCHHLILCAVTKRTANRDNKKIQLKIARKHFRSCNPFFAHQNMFVWAFLKPQKCSMQPLSTDNT